MAETRVKYTMVRLSTEYCLESTAQVMAVLGSHQKLGTWNPKCAALARNAGKGQWVLDVQLPSNQVTCYKWAVLDRESMEVLLWEEREDRSLVTVSKSFHMNIQCDFNGSESVTKQRVRRRSCVKRKEQPCELIAPLNEDLYTNCMMPSQDLTVHHTLMSTSVLSLEKDVISLCMSKDNVTAHTEMEFSESLWTSCVGQGDWISGKTSDNVAHNPLMDQCIQTETEIGTMSEACSQTDVLVALDKDSASTAGLVGPMKTLAIGLGIGLVAGVLLGRLYQTGL